MSTLEWAVQGLLIALLLVALPVGWRLERRIAALRRDGGAFERGAAGVAEATGAAEAALTRLRATAEAAGRGVAERVAAAEPLREDLRFLTERAEAIADRLEALVRAGRGPAGDAPPVGMPSVAARSEAERDLLRALRGGR